MDAVIFVEKPVIMLTNVPTEEVKAHRWNFRVKTVVSTAISHPNANNRLDLGLSISKWKNLPGSVPGSTTVTKTG